MADLPNFFVVGAAKAGTTALYHYFRAHPQIYVPQALKEPNYMAFFAGLPPLNGPGDRIHSAGKSITRLEDYRALYAPRSAESVVADVSPAYLYYSQAATKIAELCPQAKIAIILRNPIEGALSMFSMMHRDRREPCSSIEEAFRRTPARLAAGWEWAWDYQHCFFYAAQVQRYLDLFPRSQLFIRRYQDLKQTPEKFYAELSDFLDVENIALAGANPWVNNSATRSDLLRRNRTGKVIVELARAARKLLPKSWFERSQFGALEQPAFVLTPSQRLMLRDHFQGDIHKLSLILKWNLDDWLCLEEPSSPAATSPASQSGTNLNRSTAVSADHNSRSNAA